VGLASVLPGRLDQRILGTLQRPAALAFDDQLHVDLPVRSLAWQGWDQGCPATSWPRTLDGTPPIAWELAVRALVSKIRALLEPVAGRPGQELITAAFGCYQLNLPDGAWVDLHAATAAAHAAETALAAGQLDAAGAEALVASMISRRPFLAGVDGPWASERRRWLQDARIRALECLSEIWRRKGDHGQAARDAETILRLDSYRETAYLRLMLAHAAAGNRASALLAYERCRARLAAELGTSPGAAIQALHLDLLRAR
jgi:DNA-binding SARP family transcriptional activator